MVRMMVQFSEEQAERLRERAKKQGVSISELVRQGVDRLLVTPTPDEEVRRRALSVIGCVRSETGDVAERHNEIFAEAALEQ